MFIILNYNHTQIVLSNYNKKLILLVGSMASGKSTFYDNYLSKYKLTSTLFFQSSVQIIILSYKFFNCFFRKFYFTHLF